MSKNFDAIERTRALDQLAHEINDRYAQAIFERSRIRMLAKAYAIEALLCGRSVNEARKLVPHGRWMKWVNRTLPHVHHATVWRWAAVAKFCTVQNLEEAEGLKSIYLALGLLPQDPETDKPAVQFAMPILERLCSGWIRRMKAQERTILAWPEAERRAAASLLEPFVRLHRALAGDALSASVAIADTGV